MYESFDGQKQLFLFLGRKSVRGQWSFWILIFVVVQPLLKNCQTDVLKTNPILHSGILWHGNLWITHPKPIIEDKKPKFLETPSKPTIKSGGVFPKAVWRKIEKWINFPKKRSESAPG